MYLIPSVVWQKILMERIYSHLVPSSGGMSEVPSVSPFLPLVSYLPVLRVYVVPSEFAHSPTTWYTFTSSFGFTSTLTSCCTCSILVTVELLPQLNPVVAERPSFTENISRMEAPTSPDTVKLVLPPDDVVLAADVPLVIVTFRVALPGLLCLSLAKNTYCGIAMQQKRR